MALLTCEACGHAGDHGLFNVSLSVYHDFRCSVCGSTSVNTSAMNAEWKAQGHEYGYGDHNFLKMDDNLST